jgi:hypothetical protein
MELFLLLSQPITANKVSLPQTARFYWLKTFYTAQHDLPPVHNFYRTHSPGNSKAKKRLVRPAGTQKRIVPKGYSAKTSSACHSNFPHISPVQDNTTHVCQYARPTAAGTTGGFWNVLGHFQNLELTGNWLF